MKNQYKYFIVDEYIIRVSAWHVNRHKGRYCMFFEANESLWERAEKYGFKQLSLV